jgi:hypothetical protein
VIAWQVAAVAAFAIAAPAAASTLTRPEDPVVMRGAQLGALQGQPPGSIVAFRYSGGWQQVPVQVDERTTIDIRKPFGDGVTQGVLIEAYADAGTYTGADPDPQLDADDEVVVMAEDAGSRVPFSEPPGVLAGTGVQVEVADPLSAGAGYVYLFVRSGSLDPGAGQQYVDYDFHLIAGTYPADYDTVLGPNPEDTFVTTPFYSHHFSDRWVDDQLRITNGAATGVDVLDRHKFMLAPGDCGRSENTFSLGKGSFVTNKVGPVRAIRSYMGANSGGFTQREHVFYERRQDLATFLRVHAINGALDLFDYSPAASGMTYRYEFAPAGVTIDGLPESPAPGQLTWETADGPQGGLSMPYRIETDIVPFPYSSYYLDNQSPGGGAERQCTGDSTAYGISGPWINHGIPNTDPTIGQPFNRLTTMRFLYYEAPGQTNGPARKAQALNPLQIEAIPKPTGYPRPKGASPARFALVPAYRQCGTTNRTHGSSLAFGSCAPPAPESPHLTVGTPDVNGAAATSSGFVSWQARFENPATYPPTSADDADVGLIVSISDVRLASGLADYTGEVDGETTVRMTDRNGGTPTTVQDWVLGMSIPCFATPDPAIGATCALATTLEALVPGAVSEGQRTILDLSQVNVKDGGADGLASTEPNAQFMRQGVFVP